MFGLKYIFVWLLANYSYDNLLKTYNSYNNENTFDSMSKFIEKQQYREDQLREQCNLQYYKIKDKPTIYDEILTKLILGNLKSPEKNNFLCFTSCITSTFSIPKIMLSKILLITIETLYNTRICKIFSDIIYSGFNRYNKGFDKRKIPTDIGIVNSNNSLVVMNTSSFSPPPSNLIYNGYDN